MSDISEYAGFVAGLAVLGLSAVALARWAGVRLGWQPAIALLRATLQLAVIAMILSGVLTTLWTVPLFVLLMLTTAAWTAGGRLKDIARGRIVAVIGVLVGTTLVLIFTFVLRLVDSDPRQVIAIAGIVIGGTMGGATLAGRMFHENALRRSAEVEGWLALGATPSQAHADIASVAVQESLLPTLDQSRTTGLVTLPGAFVGALFGGADPVSAAQFQLVVLASLTLARLATGIVVTRLAGRSPTIAVPPIAAQA